MMFKTIKVLLVDDHPVVREGLRGILGAESDIDVVGEAGSAADAVAVARAYEPDVVLMDLRMPDGDGVQATRDLLARDPNCRVVVLTTYENDADILRAVEAGATGYLLKDAGRSRTAPPCRRAGVTARAPVWNYFSRPEFVSPAHGAVAAIASADARTTFVRMISWCSVRGGRCWRANDETTSGKDAALARALRASRTCPPSVHPRLRRSTQRGHPRPPLPHLRCSSHSPTLRPWIGFRRPTWRSFGARRLCLRQ